MNSFCNRKSKIEIDSRPLLGERDQGGWALCILLQHGCNISNAARQIFLQLVFPKPNYPNPRVPQLSIDLPVTASVAEDFGPPKWPVCLWEMATSAAPVPKTAINEDSKSLLWKIEIRLPYSSAWGNPPT